MLYILHVDRLNFWSQRPIRLPSENSSFVALGCAMLPFSSFNSGLFFFHPPLSRTRSTNFLNEGVTIESAITRKKITNVIQIILGSCSTCRRRCSDRMWLIILDVTDDTIKREICFSFYHYIIISYVSNDFANNRNGIQIQCSWSWNSLSTAIQSDLILSRFKSTSSGYL